MQRLILQAKVTKEGGIIGINGVGVVVIVVGKIDNMGVVGAMRRGGQRKHERGRSRGRGRRRRVGEDELRSGIAVGVLELTGDEGAQAKRVAEEGRAGGQHLLQHGGSSVVVQEGVHGAKRGQKTNESSEAGRQAQRPDGGG